MRFSSSGPPSWQARHNLRAWPRRLPTNGQVTWHSSPAPNLRLDLRLWDGSVWSTRATTLSDANGHYSLVGAPSLGAGQHYCVRYLNTTSNPNPGPGYLWSWMGQRIAAYTAGTALPGGDFDVADVALTSPSEGASVTLPATFCWTPRGLPDDNYCLFFYDSETEATAATRYLGNIACVTVTSLPTDWPSGRTYTWWVRVYHGADPESTPYNYGDSYGERQVTINYAAAPAGETEGEGLRLVPRDSPS